MIEHLSASAVKKFNSCPKQFWYRYIERYDIPTDDKNKYIQLGNSIHNSIEEVLKNNPGVREEETLHELLTEENERQRGYPNSMHSQAKSCIETASKYISGYVSEDIQAIEDRWEMEHNGIELVGYCDLVEDGRIVDWKTGKSEGKELDEKIQAAFYIKLYEDEFGEFPEQVDFAYLDEGKRSTHNRVTDDGKVLWNNHKNEYWDDVERIISQIQHSDNVDGWDANAPEACYWCDFKLACSDYVGSEDIKRKEIEIGV